MEKNTLNLVTQKLLVDLGNNCFSEFIKEKYGVGIQIDIIKIMREKQKQLYTIMSFSCNSYIMSCDTRLL